VGSYRDRHGFGTEATNTPTHYRTGSVGRLLPGIEAYLDPVPGLERGGRLCVRGPNVMLGYLLHDRPGVLEPPQTLRGPGWYDTGDIAAIDGDGSSPAEMWTPIGAARRARARRPWKARWPQPITTS
jgi:acyl-CoA synthetase (AMP-forming)/AMP-acid ligase II